MLHYGVSLPFVSFMQVLASLNTKSPMNDDESGPLFENGAKTQIKGAWVGNAGTAAIVANELAETEIENLRGLGIPAITPNLMIDIIPMGYFVLR